MNKVNNFYDNDDNYANLFDEIDFKLLDLFLKYKNNKRIAEESKIPLSTVKRRTKNMLNDGRVNHKIEINYTKLGINKAFLFINTSKKEYSDIVNDLFKIKQILSISATLYNFDLICIAIFKDNKELFEIISSAKKTPGVKKVLIAQEINSLLSSLDANMQYVLPSLQNK
jgi:DNA-binding Lrp family transcriptional regulator